MTAGSNQSSKWLVVATVASLVGIFSVIFLALYGPFTVKISQETIQHAVDQKLPMEKTKGPIHYTIETATVNFLQNGQVGLITDVKAQIAERSISAHLVGSSRIAYRNSQFFLVDFTVETAEVIKSETKASDHKLLNSIKEKVLTEMKIDDNDLNAFLSDNHDILVSRLKDTVNHIVRDVLAHHPVYALNPDKGIKMAIAELMLKDVQVSNQTLIITLDPITGILRLLAYIVIGIMAIIVVIALVISPVSILR